jgi:hypothetical protein
MFLEKPVSGSALKVEIARLLARSRRLLSEHAPRPLGSTNRNTPPRSDNECGHNEPQ